MTRKCTCWLILMKILTTNQIDNDTDQSNLHKGKQNKGENNGQD